MRYSLSILGLVIGSLVCLFGYCAALIDWVQDYKTGVYASHQMEAVLETGAILLYSCGGFEFVRRKVKL
ncbi:hypothetical protein [Spirosoma jeollabukense]